MKEIVHVRLENEMDLILAHKRTMKLVELCGMSQIVQTSFATAVSEVSRCVINRPSAILHLYIRKTTSNRRELVAVVSCAEPFDRKELLSLRYAKRLASSLTIVRETDQTEIMISTSINYSGLLTDSRIDSFVEYFRKELPMSPYDELRKKNIQLLELSEKLKSRETQYKQLTETLPLLIFSVSNTGELTFVNRWATTFFKAGKSLIGENWTSMSEKGERQAVRELWQASLSSGQPFISHVRINSGKLGVDPLWHFISLNPVKEIDGTVTGWSGFGVDVHAQKTIEETLRSNTHLKSAQKMLLDYQKQLEEKITELNRSNHDLEQFAYIASHDLQEPLRKIRTFTELLENHVEDKSRRTTYLQKIDRAAERMAILIRDVLNYSRLSRSGSVPENVDLGALVKEVITDMELVIAEKKAVIRYDGLGMFSGIRPQLFQLFYNLIGNALKFSKKTPEITISASREPGLSSREYLVLTVADNGIGFEQQYASQVFTIFKQLNSRGNYAGTGIGLALCKKIVENHSGEISVESMPEVGTLFTIRMPVYKVA